MDTAALKALLDIAAGGNMAALAEELTTLLLDNGERVPPPVRRLLEALFERVLREADDAVCAKAAPQLERDIDLPLGILNACFLAASPAMRTTILNRNEVAAHAVVDPLDAAALLEAARLPEGFAEALSRIGRVKLAIARGVLADTTGCSLLTLAKGSGVDRGTYAAIAVLVQQKRSIRHNLEALAAYDRMPLHGAANIVAYWRARSTPLAFSQAA